MITKFKIAVLSSFMTITQAQGFTEYPPARQIKCRNNARGSAWNWNQKQNLGGGGCYSAWEQSGNAQFLNYSDYSAQILDYKNQSEVQEKVPNEIICSGGDQNKSGMDVQANWSRTSVVLNGENTITLKFRTTEKENPSFFNFYLTKDSYESNTMKLSWEDLELIQTNGQFEAQELVLGSGEDYYVINIIIPSNKLGKRTLLTHWLKDESGGSIFNCSDLFIHNTSPVCHESCQTCFDTNEQSCLTCQHDFVLGLNNECTDQIVQNTFERRITQGVIYDQQEVQQDAQQEAQQVAQQETLLDPVGNCLPFDAVKIYHADGVSECVTYQSLTFKSLWWSRGTIPKVNGGVGHPWEQITITVPIPITCSVPNCTKCVTGQKYQCNICKSGYTLSKGVCNPKVTCSVANCNQCVSGQTNTCQVCKSGYQLSNGACTIVTIPQCDQLTSATQQLQINQCVTMDGSKYKVVLIAETDTTCTTYKYSGQISCKISNCSNCSSNNVCSTCNSGYALNNNTCQLKQIICSVNNCQTCSQDNVCSTCISGYSLSGNVCQMIPISCSVANCTQCDIKGACVSCSSGFVLSSGTCKLNITPVQCNIANCASCVQDNICSQCNAGFVLNGLFCDKATFSGLVYDFEGGYNPGFILKNPTSASISVKELTFESYQNVSLFGYSGALISSIGANKWKVNFTTPQTFAAGQQTKFAYKGEGIAPSSMPPSKVQADGKVLDVNNKCKGTACNDPSPGKKIYGYFTNWDRYARKFTANDIPVANLNNIVYAFIGYDTQGKVYSVDENADIYEMPTINILLQRYPYLNSFLSFGGWTLSSDFGPLVSNKGTRTTFIKNAIKLMREVGFNGIDLDWEFPVAGPQGVGPLRPQEAENYTLFIEEIRDALDIAELEDGKEYQLAMAISAGHDKNQLLEQHFVGSWKRIERAMTSINIMSYDFHGAWKTDGTNSQAPLKANAFWWTKTNSDLQYSIEGALDFFVNTAGIKLTKFTLGIPLYGRASILANGPGDTYGLYRNGAGAPPGQYDDYASGATGVLDYRCIRNVQRGQACGIGSGQSIQSMTWVSEGHIGYQTYGKEAATPWGFNQNTYITFDDKNAVRIKIDYLKQRGMQGIMWWQISGDLPSNDSDSLLRYSRERLNM